MTARYSGAFSGRLAVNVALGLERSATRGGRPLIERYGRYVLITHAHRHPSHARAERVAQGMERDPAATAAAVRDRQSLSPHRSARDA
jgi:hypothetical protein